MTFSRAVVASLAVVALALLAGCDPQPAEDDGPAMPKQVEFTGKVDEGLAGVWTTADGGSTLDLDKSGDLSIVTVNVTPNGKAKSEMKGAWRVDGERLLLKYVNKDQSESVIAYSLAHAGNSMTSSSGAK